MPSYTVLATLPRREEVPEVLITSSKCAPSCTVLATLPLREEAPGMLTVSSNCAPSHTVLATLPQCEQGAAANEEWGRGARDMS